MLDKYEYYRNCAWNILGYSAWNILEQYDNWKVVLQRTVAIHATLGEFHSSWSVTDLSSTKIVLGNIQPKNCPIDLGSTIITNHLNIRIMKNIFTYYQTNRVNILGGYMTYSTLSEAFDALNPECGVNTITAVTMVNSKWWNNGKYTGYLSEVLSMGVIYSV